jgi:hypothetical protein
VVAVITDLIGIAVAIITVYAALTAVSRRSLRQLAESLGEQVRSASQNAPRSAPCCNASKDS